ncbi:MAG: NAD(P)-dependent oxidoreductase [Alphaproteobacteria bacterium GM202ARS2]|nr:NAD(P)-dependent oxidoreductase [Alphaproteobacteria bacterium GM202ARS2]
MSLRIAFMGLGRMGFPMAGHLAAKGYPVVVYNRTADRAEAWLESYRTHNVERAETPQACVQDCAAVFCCLGNDDDVADVLLGEHGVLASMEKGGLLIDHTTTSAQLARRVYEQAHQRGVAFLDAPLSGGEKGAIDGKLAIMVGGEEQAYARAVPIMQAYASRISHIGASGSGQLAKMVNQICVAGVLQGLSEGIAFAEAAGVDHKRVFDVVAQGAAASWQMSNRHETMAQRSFDFGFKVDWMVKDLQYCLDESQRCGCPLPLTRFLHACYQELQQNGHSASDTSSLITLLRRDSS